VTETLEAASFTTTAGPADMPSTRRPMVRRRTKVVAFVGLVSMTLAGLWVTRPSLAEICGIDMGISYAPAAVSRQSVVPAVVEGRPRWVCRTTFEDGATSQSWVGY